MKEMTKAINYWRDLYDIPEDYMWVPRLVQKQAYIGIHASGSFMCKRNSSFYHQRGDIGHQIGRMFTWVILSATTTDWASPQETMGLRKYKRTLYKPSKELCKVCAANLS
eukprot:scaffold145431_cov17-Tisochrysis_lutea.AAC.3